MTPGSFLFFWMGNTSRELGTTLTEKIKSDGVWDQSEGYGVGWRISEVAVTRSTGTTESPDLGSNKARRTVAAVVPCAGRGRGMTLFPMANPNKTGDGSLPRQKGRFIQGDRTCRAPISPCFILFFYFIFYFLRGRTLAPTTAGSGYATAPNTSSDGYLYLFWKISWISCFFWSNFQSLTRDVFFWSGLPRN